MGNSRASARVAVTRGFAALMATLVVFSTASRAIGAPADVFSSPAPVAGNDSPKAAELRSGEASVATSTGALQYSFPISVPPGRGGMVPHLSLGYSSQAPIYGTIASGWSLSIPAILEDTSQGRLRTHAPEVEVNQSPLDRLDDDRFISTMAGNRPLVPVKLGTEPLGPGAKQSYRAQNDTGFTRYERMTTIAPFPPYLWRAYTSSGTVLTFAETKRIGGCPTVGLGYAPLTGEIDPFGNEIAYYYAWIADLKECRIEYISWGMNASAGVGEIARVVFGWSASSSTGGYYAGSQRDYRTGALRVTGASRLNTITATAFPPGTPLSPDHTRLITLAYEASAEANTGALTHAPYRLLKSIQESAWRTGQPHVDLPAVSFQYGAPTTTGVQVQTATPPWITPTPRGRSLAWGYRRPNDDRWATVEAMFVDLDGDGLLDRLFSNSGSPATTCAAQWQRNLGPIVGNPTKLQFDPTLRNITLPQLKWGGGLNGQSTASATSARLEGCSLNGQATAYFNSHGFNNLCHDGKFCANSTDPDRAGTQYCNRTPTPPNGPTGTVCPLDPGGGGNTGYTTYLAYRWFDMDGDGLTDLVAAVHGDSDYYDVELGNGATGSQTQVPEPVPFGMQSWPACPGVQLCKDLGACLGARSSDTCAAGTLCSTDWTNVNSCLTSHAGVGCFAITARMPAAVPLGPLQRAPYTRCEGLYPYFHLQEPGKRGVPDDPDREVPAGSPRVGPG